MIGTHGVVAFIFIIIICFRFVKASETPVVSIEAHALPHIQANSSNSTSIDTLSPTFQPTSLSTFDSSASNVSQSNNPTITPSFQPSWAPSIKPTYVINTCPSRCPTTFPYSLRPTTSFPVLSPTIAGFTPAPSASNMSYYLNLHILFNFDIFLLPSAPEVQDNFTYRLVESLSNTTTLPFSTFTSSSYHHHNDSIQSLSLLSSPTRHLLRTDRLYLQDFSIAELSLSVEAADLLAALSNHSKDIRGTGDIISQLERVIYYHRDAVISNIQSHVSGDYNAFNGEIISRLLESGQIESLTLFAVGLTTPTPTMMPTITVGGMGRSSLLSSVLFVVLMVIAAVIGALVVSVICLFRRDKSEDSEGVEIRKIKPIEVRTIPVSGYSRASSI